LLQLLRVGVLVALALAACGRVAEGAAATTAQASASTTVSASQVASPWPIYNDPTYHFAVTYPSGFSFQTEHGVSGSGLVMAYRTVETKYLNAYPPGEISIGIYSKDATTLSGWVTKHSGPQTPSDPNRYWTSATNQTPVTVGGKSGLSFDWPSINGTTTFHSTAFFLGTAYVLVSGWWSADSSYGATLKGYHQQMLSDLQI
jgi:hypothetical protein